MVTVELTDREVDLLVYALGGWGSPEEKRPIDPEREDLRAKLRKAALARHRAVLDRLPALNRVRSPCGSTCCRGGPAQEGKGEGDMTETRTPEVLGLEGALQLERLAHARDQVLRWRAEREAASLALDNAEWLQKLESAVNEGVFTQEQRTLLLRGDFKAWRQ